MTTELTLTTERIDDFPLLLALMQRLGLPAIQWCLNQPRASALSRGGKMSEYQYYEWQTIDRALTPQNGPR